MFKVYYRGTFVSEHTRLEEAIGNARFIYFEFSFISWTEPGIPPGFMIAIDGEGRKAA